MKSILKYVFGFLIIAFVLELGLRMTGTFETVTEKRGHGFYTDYGGVRDTWLHTWTPLDSHEIDHNEFRYTYYPNSFGYREREPEWLDTTAIKLITYGDSFTEGMGAALDSSWPRHLMRIARADDYPVEMLNMGMSGADPFFNMMDLRERSMDMNPTHVIIMVNSSDLDDYLFRGGMERFLEDGTIKFRDPPAIKPVYEHSHFMRLVLGIIGFNQQLHNPFTHRKKVNKAFADLTKCLETISDLCAINGVNFMAVFMPMPHELCYHDDLFRIDGFKRHQREFNHVFLSNRLKSYFNEYIDCNDHSVFWPMDGHFTATGYQILAQLLEEAIIEEHPDFWQPNQKEE